MHILYCPSCGKKTLQETDDEDYEAGTRHACLSCGAAYWMSPAESIEVTAEADPHEVFQPLKSMFEVTLEALNASYILSRFVQKSAVIENLAAYKGKYIEKTSVVCSDDPVVEKTIKFRRYESITSDVEPDEGDV